jgi:hypothetical protein
VLQRCLDHGSAAARERLVALTVAHAAQLIGDQFGNYVVQYVLQARAAKPPSHAPP